MILHLYAVVTPQQKSVVEKVQGELKNRLPGMSFSPAVPESSLENCMAFHATAGCSRREAEDFLNLMINDPDSVDGKYLAYGFTTRMVISDLYYFLLVL